MSSETIVIENTEIVVMSEPTPEQLKVAMDKVNAALTLQEKVVLYQQLTIYPGEPVAELLDVPEMVRTVCERVYVSSYN